MFLYCFEKSLNFFSSGKKHSLQLSMLISPQDVISQGTAAFWPQAFDKQNCARGRLSSFDWMAFLYIIYSFIWNSLIWKTAKCCWRPPFQRETMMGFMMLSAFIIVSAVIWCLKNGCRLNRRSPEENICECDSCQAGQWACLFRTLLVRQKDWYWPVL